jgi:HlyD family secretion protein
MFRKAALAKLASPEQLDALMQVTTPKGWLALVATLVVILGALIWGLFGRTPDRVHGAGILLKEGGIYGVESRGSGILAEMLVDVNAHVKAGDIIARVAQTDIAESIRQTGELLEDLRENRERSMLLITRNRDAELRSLEEDRSRLRTDRDALERQIAFLEGRVEAQTEALERGLITKDRQQATSQELEAARGRLIANQAQQAQLDARSASLSNQAEQSAFNLDQEILRNERLLELTRLRHEEDTQIRSPYTGSVVSVLVNEGQEVRPGQAIVFVEPVDQPLQAVAFIPLQGARIQPGMAAQMSPEGLTWEEYGYMQGAVLSVLQGPTNPDAMNRLLRNPTLVQQFTATGSVYEVRIQLEMDPDTPTGFKWTSREGPDTAIGSGTLLQVQISVEERRPIELVIPTIRRWLGV